MMSPFQGFGVPHAGFVPPINGIMALNNMRDHKNMSTPWLLPSCYLDGDAPPIHQSYTGRTLV